MFDMTKLTMRDGNTAQVALPTGVSTEMTGPSEKRVGLIFTISGATLVIIDTKPIVGGNNGIVVPNSGVPLYLMDWMIGDMVKKPWFGFTGGPTATISFIEVFAT